MESPPIIKSMPTGKTTDGSDPERLGPVLQTWHFHAWRWRLLQVAIIWGVSAALVAVIILGSGSFDLLVKMLPSIAVVATMLATAYLAWNLIWHRAQKVLLELRPQGLAFSGSGQGVIPWTDIVHLRREPGGDSKDGETEYFWRCNVNTPSWHFHFGPLHLAGASLYEIIASRTNPLVWERLRAALLAGAEFSLGALIVGPNGIRTPGANVLAWPEIASIGFERRYVVVKGKNALLFPSIRVLRHNVDFETVLEFLDTTLSAFQSGTEAELTLPDWPPDQVTGLQVRGAA